MATYTITETIRHGDFTSVNTVTDASTWAAFALILEMSPYYSGTETSVLYWRMMNAEGGFFLDTPVSFGWADYVLTVSG